MNKNEFSLKFNTLLTTHSLGAQQLLLQPSDAIVVFKYVEAINNKIERNKDYLINQTPIDRINIELDYQPLDLDHFLCVLQKAFGKVEQSNSQFRTHIQMPADNCTPETLAQWKRMFLFQIIMLSEHLHGADEAYRSIYYVLAYNTLLAESEAPITRKELHSAQLNLLHAFGIIDQVGCAHDSFDKDPPAIQRLTEPPTEVARRQSRFDWAAASQLIKAASAAARPPQATATATASPVLLGPPIVRVPNPHPREAARQVSRRPPLSGTQPTVMPSRSPTPTTTLLGRRASQG